jgi:hypothetical protein
MFHHLTAGAKMEFENQVLSAGRALLPPCAVAVLDGGEPSEEYWDFIAEQFELALHGAAGEEVAP